jgi:hypothetical protein
MVCYEGNKELFDNIGVSSPEEMTFDSLPLQPKTTALGDYKEVTVYEFKLDEMILGERSIGYPAITLNDITVKIINSNEYSFIIGWNVLRYLSVEYAPSAADSSYRLMLDDKGKRLLEAHRNTKKKTFPLPCLTQRLKRSWRKC